MKRRGLACLALVVAVALAPSVQAQEKGKRCCCCGKGASATTLAATGDNPAPAPASKAKEVTLKGSLFCAKCELGEAKKCQTAIEVTEGGKKVVYTLDDKGTREKNHAPVCGGRREDGLVVGVMGEKDGKKIVTPSKVEYQGQ